MPIPYTAEKCQIHSWSSIYQQGARRSSVVRAFAHGAMGRRTLDTFHFK